MLFSGYLLLGIITGVLSGLLGIGGGLIVVPVLALVFALQGFDSDISTHLAIGTSLACMIFTVSSAVLAHHKKKSIDWKVVSWMSIGLVGGSWAGSLITASLNGHLLKILLGIFVWAMALRMWQQSKKAAITGSAPPNPVYILFGLVLGCISTLFGIGGGFLNVPLLSRCGLVIQKAVGSAAACSLPIALIGSVTNMYTGYGVPGLPEYATGYVFWPAFIGIIAGSIPGARLGAKLAHKLPSKVLRRVFAIFLAITGCELIIED